MTCTVTLLTNGTQCTFTVRATNAVGAGPASAAPNAVTPLEGDSFHSLPPARIAFSPSGNVDVIADVAGWYG